MTHPVPRRRHRRPRESGSALCCAPAWLALLLLLCLAAPVRAQDQPPEQPESQDQPDAPLPIGINLAARAAFVHTNRAGDDVNSFLVDSVRLFLTGPVTNEITLSFNTEYDGPSNQVRVMDAIGRFEFSPAFNVWVGRFIPPSDRSNLYGPYYSSHWSIYTDGIQDGYPFILAGRATGAAYWGQFGKVSASGGVFDGTSITNSPALIKAGRLEVGLWDAEPGYYRNGTYYGTKNVLSVGVAGQIQDRDRTAASVDLLLERKSGAGGAVSLEAEYAHYDRLGGYNARYTTDTGGYVLAGYLLPTLSGPGRIQVLGKVARASFSGGLSAADRDYRQTTTEINVNYLLKGFDARIMGFYVDTRFSAVQPDFKRAGVGIQLQR